MGSSVLESSAEKTNGFKLMRLIVDGGTEALRNIFLNIHPNNLQHVLATHHPTLLPLFRTKNIITQPQWNNLYPHPPRIPERENGIKLGRIESKVDQLLGKVHALSHTLDPQEEPARELQDQELQMKAVQRSGTSYLNSASELMKNGRDVKAIEWYEKVLDDLDSFEAKWESSDHLDLLREKALTGLGSAWFRLGDSEKAIESFQKARRNVKKESTNEDSPSNDVTKEFREEDAVTDEWVDAKIEEWCNPQREEMSNTEDLARVEKYIKEIAPSYVHTRKISIKKPFTKEVRKAMTANVKTSAYTSLLGKTAEVRVKNTKFANDDQEILNIAKHEVFKNTSAKKPARLNEPFAFYMRSIGLIGCGERQFGTCFFVTDTLVITNYHVYRMIQNEREKTGNSNLPIKIWLDYLDREKPGKAVIVEVDERENPCKIENPYLDYKIFRVRQNECLNDRVPLGPMVRNWQLSDGRVVILGHPGGDEMQDEVCVIVGYRKMLDRIRNRHELFTGVHMTNAQLLHKTEDYQGRLSYDSSFFPGSSGSPVFQIDGNIVAMHAQGYTLETGANHGYENVLTQGNSGKYSLMEFGVQFFSICQDIRRRYGKDVVNKIFPNYKLGQSDEPMDAN